MSKEPATIEYEGQTLTEATPDEFWERYKANGFRPVEMVVRDNTSATLVKIIGVTTGTHPWLVAPAFDPDNKLLNRWTHAAFLPEPKRIPWDCMEDVKLDAWYRSKSGSTDYACRPDRLSATSFWLGNHGISVRTLLNYKWSDDPVNGPWQECDKEVKV